jgi:hypothetical protein
MSERLLTAARGLDEPLAHAPLVPRRFHSLGWMVIPSTHHPRAEPVETRADHVDGRLEGRAPHNVCGQDI